MAIRDSGKGSLTSRQLLKMVSNRLHYGVHCPAGDLPEVLTAYLLTLIVISYPERKVQVNAINNAYAFKTFPDIASSAVHSELHPVNEHTN